MKLKHVVNVVKSIVHEANKRATRSPKWPALEHATLKKYPTCAACGGNTRLQVHHCKPWHLYQELELDPGNLIVLCMSTYECHLKIGHGDDFKAYNPNVVYDANDAKAHPENMEAIAARAKEARKY